MSSDTLVDFIPMESVSELGEVQRGETKALDEVYSGYTYMRAGDVIVAKITPCFENGKGALLDRLYSGVAFGSTEFHVLRPLHVSPRFLWYVTASSRFRELGRVEMTGAAGQQRVPEDFLSDYQIALPPFEVQERIAAFLDRETARIDALIEKKQRLIELLSEKRQACIEEASTCGLQPSRPMRESEDEVFGELPIDWQSTRIKFLVARIEQGWSPLCDARQADEGEWGVLKAGCVNGGSFNPAENKALPSGLEPRPELAVHVGDLLVSRANTRDLVGSCALVLEEHPQLLLCDKLYRLIAPRWIADWLWLVLQSRRCRGEIELQATGASASMLNISQSTILELPIALPPRLEAARILAETRRQLVRLTEIREATLRSIALLAERRSALITAAVTGQIDVTDAA